jgi:hypothetical protein
VTEERQDAAALALVAFVLAAPAALFCGLYLDDYSFLNALEGASPARLWEETVRYVPGRNLHVPWFALLLRLSGGSVAAMHLIGAALQALLAALAYMAARRVSGDRATALLAAAAFAVAPNHGETRFWVTLIPQCLVPAALALGALRLAAAPAGPRLGAACALFAVALFTYDQVFLLWPLLLWTAWSSDARRRPGRYAAAAAALSALGAAHLALRYLSPYASGGRPLIRAGDVLGRVRDAGSAVTTGLFPWPPRSHAHWGWTVLAAAAGLAAAWWLARELKRERSAPRDWRAAALFGLAWTALAYGPNLFWFISPRHNLLPSFGWTLTLAACARALWNARPAARPALAATGTLALCLAVVANAHELTQWADSRRLQEDFARELSRLPRPVEAVFTLDAPRRLRRAPAFNLYHDVALAAGRALSQRPPQGDYAPVPAGRGFVYLSDLSSHSTGDFHWMPAERSDLLVFDTDKRRFDCAAALMLRLPGGGRSDLPLRPSQCAAQPTLEADAALLESRAHAPSRAPSASPSVGGLALRSARLSTSGETSVLTLEWTVEAAPPARLALVPRLRGADGTLVLDSVFPRRSGKGSYPLLWPLVDDSGAAKNGRGLRQRFALRKLPAAPAATIELELFALQPGAQARRLGRVEARLQ